jgi:hypothetical protein
VAVTPSRPQPETPDGCGGRRILREGNALLENEYLKPVDHNRITAGGCLKSLFRSNRHCGPDPQSPETPVLQGIPRQARDDVPRTAVDNNRAMVDNNRVMVDNNRVMVDNN